MLILKGFSVIGTDIGYNEASENCVRITEADAMRLVECADIEAWPDSAVKVYEVQIKSAQMYFLTLGTIGGFLVDISEEFELGDIIHIAIKLRISESSRSITKAIRDHFNNKTA